ncbi:hypothetical protein S40293_03903 [Stachybotrys chartarum IBT 40293]|nr:hypothetical protein S40293_03903 [Stachybotrys chartarum IBT 40293]
MLQLNDSVSIPTSFATCSLMSNSGEKLPEKLEAIANAGFDGIELAMPDLLEYGKVVIGEAINENDYDSISQIARKVRSITDDLGLKVLMLQPFPRFEGWKAGSKERDDAFARAQGWALVMEAAGTDMLQIGSSDSPDITSEVDQLTADFVELAEMFAKKGFRIAYENWCWSTHAATWKKIWDIVRRANRPELGLCLDTFQSAGLEWADPTAKSGLLEGQPNLEKQWQDSLADLSSTLPPEKIFLLQISDAYRMDPPLANDFEGGQPPRSRWSHDCRPLPGRGYLPVKEFLRAVLKTGFSGWLSMEVFDHKEKQGNGDMEAYTKEAMRSLKELVLSANK